MIAATAASLALMAGPALAQTDVKFALDRKLEGPSAPYLVAIDKGYYKAEDLNVTIDSGPGSVAGIARVAAGTYPIGFIDINSLVKFRDRNPAKGVEAVLMIYDVPPFAIVFGIVLGLMVGWSRTIYRGLYPVTIGFNSVPKVAVVPVLIMWFGIGEIPAILTAFLISFFPIVVNVAITLAFVGTAVSETVGANAGLGYQVALAGSSFQMPLVFAALLPLAVEGMAMYAVFAYIEVYFTRWAFRSSMSAAG